MRRLTTMGLALLVGLGGCGDDDVGDDTATRDLGGAVDGSMISSIDASTDDGGGRGTDGGGRGTDGGSTADAFVASDAFVEARPCEFPSDTVNRVEATITADDWTFSPTYQQWYTGMSIPQTLKQGEHFGVRVVFEGVKPKHEAFFRRYDSDPEDEVDDSVMGVSGLSFRVHQETAGTTYQPLWYDASVPSGYSRPFLSVEGSITESMGGYVTGFNNTVSYTEFGLNTRMEGTIDCAVIFGTPLFPPPDQSLPAAEVSWQVLWFISPQDRTNADGYSPTLE